ncbi:queuine tRNA-ribosyltransferase accessory subunit-like isoform X1 [Canna indica]|uniref:Queuine tRNA-ribosyltransferase accessory subunit 2 n=1 Tax=Canna indica TaxID=4628 RepID=A0AAQ3Q6L0_9LILI|nr:queuine tRNA-ribosyltransferase accessory subunit-like isoform X1 [Canna indica]
MRFVVTKACAGGRARAGALYIGGSSAAPIETPSLLLSTCKGLPAFISRDHLSELPSPDSLLLSVSPLHFLDCPSTKTISNIGGLHQMLGLQDHFFIAATRDSLESLPESVGCNKHGATFETPSGRRLVKPSSYKEMITSLMPNLWVSLADEVPAWVSQKRNKISVDRTLRWLDECLALDPVGGKDMLGFIVGGSDIEERKHCATEVARRNVSGFWIGGFGLGENIEERSALLNAVTDSLPEEKLRLVSGLSLPEEVLQGVAAGVDLFDSTYIYHLTLGGFALIYPVNIVDGETAELQLDDSLGDCTKINLRATIYRMDTSPLVADCTCFTCQNHTRAYINHLLNVHEMLAHILLEIHNTHHYLSFFRAVREAIKSGKFDLFRQRFVESRRIHLTSTVPCS